MNKSYIDQYHRANKLLERRLRQLLKKGKIIAYHGIEHIINDRQNIDSKNLSIGERVMYSMPISWKRGIAETVRASDDWLAKKLYDLCLKYYKLHQTEATAATARYIKKVEDDERVAYAQIAKMRFVG